MTIAIMAFTIRPGEYQDIREELRKRIDLLNETVISIQSEFATKQERVLAEHKQAVDSVNKAIESYKSMLALEESFAESVLHSKQDVIGPHLEAHQQVKISLPTSRPALSEFFVAQLMEKGPMFKEELRKAAQAAGYFGDFNGGRATHATLTNITKSGRLTVNGEGKYIVSPTEKALL